MGSSLYRTAALLLRYLFTAAGIGIAAHALWMSVKDLRRSRLAREQAPDSVAVLTALPADHTGKPLKTYIERSGSVGSGRSCDIRFRKSGLKSRHFDYEITHRSMVIACAPGAKIIVPGSKNPPSDRLILSPGERFLAGKLAFRFQLVKPAGQPVSPMNRRVYRAKGGSR